VREEWSLLLGTTFTAHTMSGKSQRELQDIRKLLLALDARHARVYPTRDLILLREAGTLDTVIQRCTGEDTL
jgi:hypothetical protein